MVCMLTACAKIEKNKQTKKTYECSPGRRTVLRVQTESAGDLLIFFQEALHRKEFDCVQDWQLPGVVECVISHLV